MKTSFWRRWCQSLLGARSTRPISRTTPRHFFGPETLEDRTVPSGMPTMVRDINTHTLSSIPTQMVVVGSTTYLVADDGVHGSELWKSDGTAAGTVLVKDVFAGIAGSAPSYLTNVKGTLYFTADNSTHGRELWKSNGTAAGTVLVKDINTGSGNSLPTNLTNVNGTLFFTADDGTGGQKLWKSDGTATGTVRVANLLASSLTNVNDTLFFAADDGIHGTELWTLSAGSAAAPSLAITDVTLAEGNAGTSTALFTVSLSATSSETISVQLSTANGTAGAGSDYQAASGTLTFAPGETSKTIAVRINGDRVGEPNETFVLNLSGATNATIADGQGAGTILDDEPRISISDVTQIEGKRAQTTLFTFTVTLSAAYDQPVTVSFQTVNGTAKTSNNDYVARTGTLTFAPGETTKTITIQVKGDNKRESDEYFYLDLSGNSSNSLFAKNRGIGTILNDD
jgi:ELWxxDGT repeat protein